MGDSFWFLAEGAAEEGEKHNFKDPPEDFSSGFRSRLAQRVHIGRTRMAVRME